MPWWQRPSTSQAQVDTSISDALAPYYTAAQVDAEIAANGADLSDYYTKTESDNRYFVRKAGGGNVSLARQRHATDDPKFVAQQGAAEHHHSVLRHGAGAEVRRLQQIGKRREVPCAERQRRRRRHLPDGPYQPEPPMIRAVLPQHP